MPDLTQTATNVVKGSGAIIEAQKVAGETIVAGDSCYLKSADDKIWKTQADGTAEEATFLGYALNGAAANQPVQVQKSGEINLGATLVAGEPYCVSTNAGKTCPYSDLIATNKVNFTGYAKSTSLLVISPQNTGVTKA